MDMSFSTNISYWLVSHTMKGGDIMVFNTLGLTSSPMQDF